MMCRVVDFYQILMCTCCLHLGVASITTVQHNLANNEHFYRAQNDAITRKAAAVAAYHQPYFDTNDPTMSMPNITVMQGENAYLVCVVRHLGNNSISWIRHNDINLLSVGKYKYTQDPRYQIFHSSRNDTWTLKIRRVRKEDEGPYECQIGISTSSQPIGRMIYLKVIDPELSILEGNEMFTEVGSNLNLTCYIKQMPLLPSLSSSSASSQTEVENEKRRSLKWTHNNQEINHHSPRGVFIITERDDGASISHLMIKNLTQADTGMYSCYTSIENFANIMIHVNNANDETLETKEVLSGASSCLSFVAFNSSIVILILTVNIFTQ